MEYHIQHRLAFADGEHAVLTQMLPYVLHIDNGIVYQRADGNSHTSQAHGVDAESHIVQYQNCDDQRQRKGYQRNDGGSCIGKEQEEYDDHEDGSLVKRFLYVADRAFDETRLTEDVGRNLYIGRKILL